MAIEAVLAALVVLMLLVVTAMGIEGLMGATGLIKLGRCRTCDHLTMTTPGRVCLYCRHPHLVQFLHLHHHGLGGPPRPRAG